MGDGNNFNDQISDHCHGCTFGHSQGNLVKRGEKAAVAAPGHGLNDQPGNDNDHAQTRKYGRDEEVQPLKFRGDPQRMYLRGSVAEKRTESTLVQRRENNTGNGQPQGDLFYEPLETRPVGPF